MAFVIILTIVSGCGKGKDKISDGSKAPTSDTKIAEVSYWIINWSGEITNLTKDVINDFNEKNPGIKVKLYPVTPTPNNAKLTIYDEKFLPSVAAGTPPDIIMCGKPTTLVEHEIIADLTPFIEKSGMDMDMYYPFKISDIKYNDKYYALPYEFTVEGIMLYNKTLFKKAGLDPNSPPKTIEELDTMAERMFLTDNEGNYTQIGFIPWEWLIKNARCLIAPFGGRMVDDDGNPTPADPNNIKAFEWANGYAMKYGYDRVNKYLESLPIPIVPFRFGGVGMMYAYNGQVNEQILLESSFEWDVSPFPSVSGGAGATVGGGWNLAITEGSKEKEAAFEFLKYYAGKEGQMKLFEGFIRGLLYGYSPIRDVNIAYKDRMHPAQRVLVDLILDDMQPVKNVKLPVEYGKFMNEAVIDMLSGKGEPRQLLADVEKKVNALMNEQSK